MPFPLGSLPLAGILDEGDDDDDVLVNVNMAEADRMRAFAEEKRRMELGAGADLEDSLGLVRSVAPLPSLLPPVPSIPLISSHRAGLSSLAPAYPPHFLLSLVQKHKKILDKYDDIDQVTGDREIKSQRKFKLGEAEMERTPEEQEREVVKQKLKMADSLDMDTNKFGSDFYTSEEMSQFKKKKKRKVRRKKKVRVHQLTPATGVFLDGFFFLSPSLSFGGTSQPCPACATACTCCCPGLAPHVATSLSLFCLTLLSPRQALTAAELMNSEEDAASAPADAKADEDAPESTAMDTAGDAQLDQEKLLDTAPDPELEQSELLLEAELQSSLERARRARQKKRSARASRNVASLVAENATKKGVEERNADDGLVFSAMSEFVRGVGGDEDDGSSKRVKREIAEPDDADEDEEMGDAAAAAAPAAAPAAAAAAKKAVKAEEEDDDVLGDDVDVGKGIAAALTFAQRKGIIKRSEENKAKAESEARRSQAAGSSRDPFSLKEYKPSFKLEYKDEFGRVISSKEQYRRMCHAFHGIEPGKIKTEKRLKKIKEEERLKKASSEDGMMDAMRRQQARSGAAHIVLSGAGAA